MTWLKSLSPKSLSALALVFAAVTLLAVNLFSVRMFNLYRADLTASKLFTISDATRSVLANLREPITVRLYYSRGLGDLAPNYGQYAERVRASLSHYADLAGGRLRFETVDPEPFSDAEDRAVAVGLRGASLGEGRGTGYFGLVGTNSTDDEEVIPFMALERANFLEYDLTRMVHKLADPKRKVIGMLTPLRVAGGLNPQTRQQIPAWLVHEQLQEFFELRNLAPNGAAIADDVDLLLLIAPAGFNEATVYQIEQFALKGKPVVVFADPNIEANPQLRLAMGEKDPIHKVFKAWGVDIPVGRVVGDINFARRVQFGGGAQPQIASYVPWLELGADQFDKNDALFGNLNLLTLASAGRIDTLEEASTTVTPLLKTSNQATTISADRLAQPDPLQLLQTYVPGNEEMVLAARISGTAKTAFPDGPKIAEGADNAPSEPGLKEGDVSVVMVADADMLHQTLWAEVAQVLGQRMVIPRAGNADFLLNILESQSGGAALSGLRGRGVEQRPFTRVQKIRQEAEVKYRRQEQELNTKLDEVQRKLGDIQTKSRDGQVILGEADKEAILGFRQQVVSIRRELRGVQRALQQDIENLSTAVKVINIAGVPLLILLGCILFAFLRRRPTARRTP